MCACACIICNSSMLNPQNIVHMTLVQIYTIATSAKSGLQDFVVSILFVVQFFLLECSLSLCEEYNSCFFERLWNLQIMKKLSIIIIFL